VATISAHQQGATAGELVEAGYVDAAEMSDDEIERMLSGEDPEAMEALELSVGDRALYTWVATLVNTCHHCLALHGKRQTKDQWREQGLDPETIHAANSINAPCYCRFVLSESVRDDDLSTVEPLRRLQIEGRRGVAGNRKTQRAVTQPSIERATKAAAKAAESKSGRQALRAMGNAAPPEVADAVRAARAEAREDKGDK
jgi:hypothetical protein